MSPPPESTPGAPASPSRAPADDSIESWRRRVLEMSLWLTFAIGVSVTAVNYWQNGWDGAEAMQASWPGWILISISTLWRRGPTSARAWLLLIGFEYVIGTFLLLHGFHVPNPFTGALFLSCVAALILSPRAAWAAVASLIITMVAIAIGYSTGWRAESAMLTDVHRPENWVRVIANFSLISAMTVGGVLFMVSKFENALRKSEALNAALEQESEERLRAVHQRHALEAQLQHAQRLESLGSLTGGVAHDFNNLLYVISAGTELASDPASTADEKEQALDDIAAAAKRASGLTQQLLAFSRKQAVELGEVDVGRSVTVLKDLLVRLLPSNIRLVVNVAEPLSSVRAVPTAISQIVMNLTINSRDAMPNGGTISVDVTTRRREPSDAEGGATSGSDFVMISVTDDGSGMDHATLERAFEPFFTTKPAGVGTGLGLSLVKSLAAQSGGFVEVESTLGQGTRVAVYLRASNSPT